MRRPTRRVAIALVIAVTVFTAVVAFASSLTVTSTNLQAGAAAVGRVCTGTLATTYTSSGVDVNGDPLIKYVDVNPAAGVCTNGTAYTVTVYLESGSAGAYSVLGTMTATLVTIATTNSFTAASGTGVTYLPPLLQFDFSSLTLKVTDLANVAVVIS